MRLPDAGDMALKEAKCPHKVEVVLVVVVLARAPRWAPNVGSRSRYTVTYEVSEFLLGLEMGDLSSLRKTVPRRRN